MLNMMRLVVPVAFLVVWQLVCSFGLVRPLLLPSPGLVLTTLFSDLGNGVLLIDILHTLRRFAIGYFAGAIVGIPLGIVVGSSKTLRLVFDFPVDFLRSLPVTSLLPLFLLVLGVGDVARIAIVAYASGLLIFFNTVAGIQMASRTRRRVAQLLGASRFRQFIDIVFPEALPQIVVGLRLAGSAAFIYAIVTEMFFGSVRGIGYRILESNLNYEIPTMYAAIFAAGILGYALNVFIVTIEARFVHWKGHT
jgi:ABC-type nitrate/sulfonate/bicarbonate transport system permease component